ncbi:hypothetical protein GUJ93_ZPchr0005g15358 [Zizania palustris]|uniref:Methyltransferase type 11 domain-containing protein n=1 Tax=Zizania palustris TaxID=103762 RepID=A0A8J5W0N4_ZIZPA|nr:hypothetical protein GUJ93_ZPchr0005g15358 [Zizania palustris]
MGRDEPDLVAAHMARRIVSRPPLCRRRRWTGESGGWSASSPPPRPRYRSCTSSATHPPPASPRPTPTTPSASPSPSSPSRVLPATPPPAASWPRTAASRSSVPPRAGAAGPWPLPPPRFPPLRGLRLLAGSSRVLCLAAGAGHAVDALHAEGVRDVTGIDLVDFPPLVRRADPHHLPFSDGSFDLVFSDDPAGVSGALFPSRIAAEAERAVRVGGAIALAVDRHLDPAAVAALFKRSRVVDLRDVTLDGSQVRMLIFQTNGTTSNSI